MEKDIAKSMDERKLSISHLKVFESVVHVHTAYEKWTKLDDKREKFIFIGYDSKCSPCSHWIWTKLDVKLYNSNNNKIVNSRDKIFDEEWECTLLSKKIQNLKKKTSREVQQKSPSTSDNDCDTRVENIYENIKRHYHKKGWKIKNEVHIIPHYYVFPNKILKLFEMRDQIRYKKWIGLHLLAKPCTYR